MAKDERSRALELAILQIEKEFGKESIMKLGEHTSKIKAEVVPSGSIQLDVATGIGGVPRGRVIEIYGPEASGKTTLSLHIVAQAQKLKGNCAFIDAEHALDPVYASSIGVDTDNLLISQPDSGEQALEITDRLVRSGAMDVIVIDSVAALVPKAEIEGEMGDSHMGLQARLMSQALRKLTSNISRSKTTVIFINQVRQKIGVMFGNPETTTGGLALKFYASLRLDVRRIESIKTGDQITGSRLRIKIVKNKLSAPFKQVEVEMVHGKGISYEAELLDMGVNSGIIEKSGAWFIYGGEKIGQGRENAKRYLESNKDIAGGIEAEIRRKYFEPEKEEKKKDKEPITAAKHA